jgi:Tol biopolymer transport system component
MKQKAFSRLCLTRVRRVTVGSTDHEHPAWSPDGRTLAFSAGPVDARHVFLVDRRGRFSDAVAPGGPAAARPRWAPDGRRLAFDVRPHDGPLAVFVQDLPETGRDPRPLVRAREGAAIHAAFAPDGRWLAYASDDRPVHAGDAHAGKTFHLWLLDLESGERRQLTDEAESNDAHPAFSPDGSLVAFHRYHGVQANQSSLYLLNVASGSLLRLTEAPAFDKHAAFATDDIVLFHRETTSGYQELRAVHVVEGYETVLTSGELEGQMDVKQPAVRVTRRGGLRVAFAGRHRGTVAGTAWPYNLHTASLDGLV